MSNTEATFLDHLKQAGLIRHLLFLLSIISIILKPDNGATVTLEGFAIVTTLILPVAAPLLITGHLLDALMGRIYASEQDDATRAKFRTIVRADLLMSLLLLITWVPYMLAIG